MPAPFADLRSIYHLFDVISAANRRYQFESLMTYEANGYITSLKLRQHLRDNRVHQQLTFMNGPNRQVIRQQGLSVCEQGGTRWGLWPDISQTAHAASLATYYDFYAAGQERVANRDALVFEIKPLDEFRYGYRYSIDQQTGLVVKLIVLHKNKIIERIQTVTLDLSADKPGLAGTDTRQGYALRVPEVEPCYNAQFNSQWQVNWLPEGFVPVGNRVTALGEQVLMFADGLVSVSVFITDERVRGLSKVTARHGAMVAVVVPATAAESYHIAVVGEVPNVTARRMAVSVSRP
ncbi:MAG: MucB/RseB C-terminal domain-containing protein [Cellvibrionaceae bacterium]|nr:MucB/RseB C-terminal domain-containing protein [Cellvibrionaceae bacterium]